MNDFVSFRVLQRRTVLVTQYSTHENLKRGTYERISRIEQDKEQSFWVPVSAFIIGQNRHVSPHLIMQIQGADSRYLA